MKILHLSSAQSWRGGEQQIAYLLLGLRTSSVENVVFCPSHSALQAWCSREGIPVVDYHKVNLSPRVVVLLIRTVETLQPDIIHIHDAHSHTFAVMAATAGHWSIPFVLHRRVDFPIKRNVFSRWKYNHSSIRAILCVSDAIRDIVLQDIRRKEIVHTVYSGVDLDNFGKSYPEESGLRIVYQVPEGKFIVANIAALAPHKDYKTFVDTVRVLKEKGFNASYFAIGEDGGELENVRRYAAQSGVETDITFTGFRKDIAALAQDIDVLLVTSKEEGLCTSILDAFAGGIPVVATRAGGIPEIVRHEETGLTAPVQDPQLLATHVMRMLNDSGSRNRLVEKAKEFVKEFSFQNMAEKVRGHYVATLKNL